MTIVLTHSINQEQQELVKKCLNAYNIQANIKDILYVNVKDLVKKHQFVITFGKIPASLVEAEVLELITKPVIVNLPHPKQLTNIPENQQHRQETAKQLQQTAQSISETPIDTTTLTITEKDLPILDEQKVLLLQKLSEMKSSMIINKSGNLIEIGNQKRGNTDLFFTIEELFMLEKVMKTFDVKEVQIIKDK
jgi:hypothetical protein